MIHANPLRTDRLELRNLEPSDATARYVGWLNDPGITRFLEVRFHTHTIESTADFIRSVNASPDTILFGLFVDGGRRHIGNIKLGPVNLHHRRADIGLVIGDRAEWGKGYATEAIALVTAFGFHELGLVKITAGCYGANQGSLKAFEKAGFLMEARLPQHWITPDGPDDEFLIGLTAGQHAELTRVRPARRFGGVRQLTFIGGGDLMIETAARARELGYRVTVVMAPRHSEETLPLAGTVAHAACAAAGLAVAVVENINAPGAVAGQPWAGPEALALCFGPAWIFSDAVIAAFGSGMINFNGIPIPHYLGGAHYTWQIMNGNRQGGCFLQEITSRLDQGGILRAELFPLPLEVTTPQDYFVANHRRGYQFLGQALADFWADLEFPVMPFAKVNRDRLYFPRLLTKHNGWIDWNWSGREIALFCQAFDEPYMGAATFWREKEVRLKQVKLVPRETGFHSYAAGLVVRKLEGKLWVATTDGLLQIESVGDGTGGDLLKSIREGDRLVTPQETIHRARIFRPVVQAR